LKFFQRLVSTTCFNAFFNVSDQAPLSGVQVMKLCKILIFIWGMSVGLAQAAVTGTLIRDQNLLDSPNERASVVAKVSKSTSVDVLQRRAGWVQVNAQGKVGWVRMLALKSSRDSSSSSLSKMLVSWWDRPKPAETTRITAIAGLRSLPKPQPSSHALIMAAGDYQTGIPRLTATNEDIDAAVMIANGMGVPEENMVVLKEADLALNKMRKALDDLLERVLPGDQVFIYFSGHGTRVSLREGGKERCAEGLLAADGGVLTDVEIETLLKNLSSKARRVVTFFDASHSGGVASSSAELKSFKVKNWHQPNTKACTKPSYALSTGLITRALGERASAGNFIHIASSRADEASLEETGKGSLATQSWLQCLGEGAKDLDASGGISISEIGDCAQNLINQKLPSKSGFNPQQMILTGNSAMVVAASAGSETISGGAKAALQDIFVNRDAGRLITLDADPINMRIRKDRLGLKLHSSHAGYVYLLMVDSSGKTFDMLFPNKRDTANYIRAGETLQLPRRGWDVMAGGPPGQNTVLAIVSDSPRDFTKLGMKPAGPFSVVAADSQAVNHEIQSVVSSASNADNAACSAVGGQRALMVIDDCSDVYGAAIVTINEIN
jgi:hypothetical protein